MLRALQGILTEKELINALPGYYRCPSWKIGPTPVHQQEVAHMAMTSIETALTFGVPGSPDTFSATSLPSEAYESLFNYCQDLLFIVYTLPHSNH